MGKPELIPFNLSLENVRRHGSSAIERQSPRMLMKIESDRLRCLAPHAGPLHLRLTPATFEVGRVVPLQILDRYLLHLSSCPVFIGGKEHFNLVRGVQSSRGRKLGDEVGVSVLMSRDPGKWVPVSAPPDA